MFRDRSASRHGQRKSLDGWDKVLKFAEEALEKSQDAEALRQVNSIVNADATTETAFKTLKLRYNFVNKIFLPYKLTYQQYRCGADCRGIRQPAFDKWLE